MNCRNTKQKDIILNAIKVNKNHPTIAEICESVMKIDPSIGQATVYRNVKKFLEEKKIYQIKTKGGIDRYDYYKDHIHFECLQCGKITDIMESDILITLKDHFSNRLEEITYCNVMLEGYCEKCRKR